jgi:mono/diheme cytochrome c family protein
MKDRVWGRNRSVPMILLLVLLLGLWSFTSGSMAQDESKDPYIGNPDAIKAGRATYGNKCYICHHSAGARGPNLFASKLTDEQFLETVTNGRPNTQMPAFGGRLSTDEIWQLHAFIKSTDHY